MSVGAVRAQTVVDLSTTATTAADWTVAGSTSFSQLGFSVDSAGDVNSDGYEDLIVGCIQYSNGQSAEGQAQVYLGSPTGLSTTPSWTYESDQASAKLGSSVAGAGDVNGDGYDDVIVGALQYTNGEYREGTAFLFHGSADGLAATPAVLLDGDQEQEFFGQWVDGAGDVNNDGYADVIVGAHFAETNGEGVLTNGRALVYLGSESGVSATPVWVGTGGQSLEYGFRVAGLGDVNGDGYDDVGVAAVGYSTNPSIFVYFGSATGPSATADWTANRDNTLVAIGRSIGAAGDINADGYDDLILGDEAGKAHLFHGSATGFGTTPQWTGQFTRTGYTSIRVMSVSGAGDVNDDGYSDVLIGASIYQNSYTNPGKVFLIAGSADGLGRPGWGAAAEDLSHETGFAYGVAFADANGDGKSDVFVGDYNYDGNPSRTGKAYGYYSGQDVTVSPTDPVDFGTCDRDNRGNAVTFEITNPEMAPVTLTGAGVTVTGTNAADFIVAENATNPPQIAGGEVRQFTVTFDPTDLGDRSATLVITTDVPGKETFPIPLSGFAVYQDIEVDAGSVDFGSIAYADLPATRTVTIQNTGTGSLNFVSPVASFDPYQPAFGITVSSEPIPPGESRDLTVTFNKAAGGEYTSTLKIWTEDGDESVVSIPVSGTVLAPRLEVTPAFINFSRAYTDAGPSPEIKQVTLKNIGTEELSFTSDGYLLTESSLGGGPGPTLTTRPSLSFFLDGVSTAPIPVGGTRQWNVYFDPARAAHNTATLRFLTNAPGSSPTVGLSGTGMLSLTSAPGIISNSFWVRADQDVVKDAAGTVEQWTNAMGFYEVLQPTAASRPLWVENGLNGKPVVRFDGADDYMSLNAAAYLGGVNHTIVVVGRPTGEDQVLLGTASSTSASMKLAQGPGNKLRYLNQTLTSPPTGIDLLGGTLSSSTGQIMTIRGDNTRTSVTLNGQLVAAGAPFSPGYTGLPLVFGRLGGMPTGYLNGDIAEAFAVPQTLTRGVTAGIENYLALKYQLGSSVSHNPTIAAGQTGIFRLGNTGVVVNIVSNGDLDGGSLFGTRLSGNPHGNFAPGTSATAPNGTTVIPNTVSPDRYWRINTTGLEGLICYVTFDISALPNVNDPDRLVILKRSTSGDDWVALPTWRSGNTLTVLVTSFSEFAVGANTEHNPFTPHAAAGDWQLYE